MPDNSITIVIPVFNRADELVRALSSLVDQTDKDFDVIVCDDGSTEDIYSKTKHYSDLLRVKFIRIDNSGGPARPRNKAVEIVTATWVSFLDSDDWWYAERISELRSHLSDDVDVVYHRLKITKPDDENTFTSTSSKPVLIGERIKGADALMHMIRYGNPLPTSATVVRRELLLKAGGFNESPDLASVEDFDTWLTLAQLGARFRFIDKALGAYWIGSDQISTFGKKQYARQSKLFSKHLDTLDSEYRKFAISNFSYLLGSYCLMLDMPGAEKYYSKIGFFPEPRLWLKSRIKFLRYGYFRRARKNP
ncbi:glycosyltransferase family 2 protein [Pseudomonas tohonis]|uniref:glycosyltransferase family 2 protein n=1 Tax=Pseudomonas tohonis TaxID=2725477 RepID=UPI0021DB32B1|nr:glycosyltransferase family A protein [Pseudomonas tohonis]UXY52068.1 glycosyltransferase [Pseudomonas tohonis]